MTADELLHTSPSSLGNSVGGGQRIRRGLASDAAGEGWRSNRRGCLSPRVVLGGLAADVTGDSDRLAADVQRCQSHRLSSAAGREEDGGQETGLDCFCRRLSPLWVSVWKLFQNLCMKVCEQQDQEPESKHTRDPAGEAGEEDVRCSGLQVVLGFRYLDLLRYFYTRLSWLHRRAAGCS